MVFWEKWGAEIVGHPWAYWKEGLAYWLAGLEELKLWEERAEDGQEPKTK